jgi:L-threonylcarbamoyladenylate synthase
VRYTAVTWANAAERLKEGEIGVIPTDTLYGVVGSALQQKVVDRIYKLRHRQLDKPLIVLIGSWEDFRLLKIQIDDRLRSLLQKVWPGPVSVIVSTPGQDLEYLHRGTYGIALRMPAKTQLRELLAQTGPIVAPSANLAGEQPAETIEEARSYFGERVFYLDEGHIAGSPSALVDSRVDPFKILRSAPGFSLQ